MDGVERACTHQFKSFVKIQSAFNVVNQTLHVAQGGMTFIAVDEAGAREGRKVVLKVIIESGVLATPERIADASFLAMECGADFIKTSTGKVDVNATPMAAYVMCECIRKFYEKTGRKVGFKAAGGVSTVMDAICYYSIVSAVLGNEWLNPTLFRFGVSRLANNLMSAIEQKTVAYF